MEEGGKPLYQLAVLVILLLLRLVHLVLQLPHHAADLLPVHGQPAVETGPGEAGEGGVSWEDGAVTLLAEHGAQEGAQLGWVLAPPAAALEEPTGLDVRAPLEVPEEEGDVLDGDLLPLLYLSLGPESQPVVWVDDIAAVVVAVVRHEGEGRVDGLARGPLVLEVGVLYLESVLSAKFQLLGLFLLPSTCLGDRGLS